MNGGMSSVRVVIAALVVAILAAAGVAFADGGSRTSASAGRAFTDGCGVFPPADVAANSASLPDQRAWNQDISAAPVASNSAAIIKYINGHGAKTLHPDFGSNTTYGIPYTVVGSGATEVRVRF